MPTHNHTAQTVSHPVSHLDRKVTWFLLLLGTLLLYLISLWWGEINQDEGWYLYAGRMIVEQHVPYRDFAFTQGPVMAYFSAMAYPLVQWQGVLGGRMLNVMVAWGALGLALLLARMVAQRKGQDPFYVMLLVTAFWGLNLYHVYFTTIVKTYALAAFCMLAGLILLEYALVAVNGKGQGTWRSFVASFLGGILLALAAGTRLSAILLLPACWLPVAVRWVRMQRPRGLLIWLSGLLAGGTLGVLLLFLPFVLMAPEGLQFGLLRYHGGRAVETPFALLAYKAGFALRQLQAYWPLLAVLMLLPWSSRAFQKDFRQGVGASGAIHVPLGVGFIAVTLVHLLSVFPYDDYQVFVMPLAMIVVAIPAGRVLEGMQRKGALRGAWCTRLLAVLLVFSLSGSMLQGWLVGPRNLIWWPLREQSSLAQLRQVGKLIRAGTPRATITGKMVTQDLYLAVEAGYRVPRGLEMGPFANFWGLSDAEASRLQVLNFAGTMQMLAQTNAEWAAYSAYGFAIETPGVVPVTPVKRAMLLAKIDDFFSPVAVIPAFGQAQTDLRLYERTIP